MPASSSSYNAPTLSRPATTVLPPPEGTPSFLIGSSQKSYRHQYSNIYFFRLNQLKDHVVKNAQRRWQHLADKPTLVPRVLEVTKGKICYIVGTVYMEMPLKPNVLIDLARDNSIEPPPPVAKFYSSNDSVMLEDESGRIRLVGAALQSSRVVTGVIAGVLGMETPNGDFEVVDMCFADMSAHASGKGESEDEEMSVDDSPDPWIGVISGLEVGSEASSEARIQMLVEYLTAESGLEDDQVPASQISRLIIAGDSLAPISTAGKSDYQSQIDERKARKTAQDTSTFTPHPIHNLSSHLLDVGRTIPIHLLPGGTDPSGSILPQQPLPKAMFGEVSKIPSFVCESNPTYIKLAPGVVDEASLPAAQTTARTLLVHSGQPLNDMFKYLPNRHNSRLGILESTLKWRHIAPTAPDTLWCHPYLSEDPFIMKQTPDIYVVGGQARFGTKMVVGDDATKKGKVACRVVLVPNFARTGTLVLINMRSLEVRCVQFGVQGMTGGGGAPEEAKLKAPKATPMPIEPLSSEQQMGGSPGPM